MFVVAALVMIAVAVGLLLIRATPKSDEPRRDTSAEWQRAQQRASSSLDRALLSASKPLSQLDLIYERSISPQYRWLQQKLLAAGGVYAGSVEVFLSMQVFVVLLALGVVGVAFLLSLTGVPLVVATLLSASLVGWPYTQVNKAAKKRAEEINTHLPGFADLLLMPLASGMGVIPSISFTVKQLPDSVVKEEVSRMLKMQETNPQEQTKAFVLAGERLGTPEAKAFFTALLQAYTEGTAVSDTIEGQAGALREKVYQLRSETVEKLPAQVSVVMAIHIVPALLIISMFPLFVALGDM